jgi:inhibitor of cysteine peptidase
MSNKPYIMLLVIAGVIIVGAIIGLALIKQNDTVIPSDEMKKFSSPEELKAYLVEHRETYSTGGYGVRDGREVFLPAEKTMESSGSVAYGTGSASAPMPTSVPTFASSPDYSTTNIQVQGVDEADIVKSDGKYLYILTGGTLVIIDAYPADTSKIVSMTAVNGQPFEIFQQKDRVVVFTTVQDESYVKPATSVAPVPIWRTVTQGRIYDISDRSNPVLSRTLTFSGTYFNSRMIGDDIYILTSESVPWYDDNPVLPLVKTGDDREITPDIYYFDMPYYNYVYYTISSFSLTSGSDIKAQTFLAGYSTTLYVSMDNMYLAYQKQIPYTRIQPPRPLGGAGVAEQESPTEGTVIHRFAINNGNIEYKATGDVPGHLLNQFSMDEYKGNLRVATTVEGYGQDRSYMYNNVYVLDPGLKTIGSLEYIAPDERIYSTRFIGERLYMVTFKRIDPFFVIDLSDPAMPFILGKLKIPGYSDYLHPYDSNHIIGIGKETETNDWGGVSTAGLKLALFDVTDVNNPRLLDKAEIGDSGTDSPALQDHRAFLFDREKNLLVIPVREVTKTPAGSDLKYGYRPGVWQGVYAYGLTPETGFVLKGTVEHGNNDIYGYWNSPQSVKRSLFIGDVLYTMSETLVKMNSLSDLKKELNQIPLPSSVTSYPRPLYME